MNVKASIMVVLLITTIAVLGLAVMALKLRFFIINTLGEIATSVVNKFLIPNDSPSASATMSSSASSGGGGGSDGGGGGGTGMVSNAVNTGVQATASSAGGTVGKVAAGAAIAGIGGSLFANSKSSGSQNHVSVATGDGSNYVDTGNADGSVATAAEQQNQVSNGSSTTANNGLSQQVSGLSDNRFYNQSMDQFDKQVGMNLMSADSLASVSGSSNKNVVPFGNQSMNDTDIRSVSEFDANQDMRLTNDDSFSTSNKKSGLDAGVRGVVTDSTDTSGSYMDEQTRSGVSQKSAVSSSDKNQSFDGWLTSDKNVNFDSSESSSSGNIRNVSGMSGSENVSRKDVSSGVADNSYAGQYEQNSSQNTGSLNSESLSARGVRGVSSDVSGRQSSLNESSSSGFVGTYGESEAGVRNVRASMSEQENLSYGSSSMERGGNAGNSYRAGFVKGGAAADNYKTDSDNSADFNGMNAHSGQQLGSGIRNVRAAVNEQNVSGSDYSSMRNGATESGSYRAVSTNDNTESGSYRNSSNDVVGSDGTQVGSNVRNVKASVGNQTGMASDYSSMRNGGTESGSYRAGSMNNNTESGNYRNSSSDFVSSDKNDIRAGYSGGQQADLGIRNVRGSVSEQDAKGYGYSSMRNGATESGSYRTGSMNGNTESGNYRNSSSDFVGSDRNDMRAGYLSGQQAGSSVRNVRGSANEQGAKGYGYSSMRSGATESSSYRAGSINGNTESGNYRNSRNGSVSSDRNDIRAGYSSGQQAGSSVRNVRGSASEQGSKGYGYSSMRSGATENGSHRAGSVNGNMESVNYRNSRNGSVNSDRNGMRAGYSSGQQAGSSVRNPRPSGGYFDGKQQSGSVGYNSMNSVQNQNYYSDSHAQAGVSGSYRQSTGSGTSVPFVNVRSTGSGYSSNASGNPVIKPDYRPKEKGSDNKDDMLHGDGVTQEDRLAERLRNEGAVRKVGAGPNASQGTPGYFGKLSEQQTGSYRNKSNDDFI